MLERVKRMYGYQKLCFGLVALPVAGIVLWIVGSIPPEGWVHWPKQARQATVLLCGGLDDLVFCLWAWWMVRPLLQLEGRSQQIGYGLLVLAGIIWGLPAIASTMQGLHLWGTGAAAARGPITWQVFRVVMIPMLIGGTVALWPDLLQLLNANAMYRRAFVSGQGPAANWEAAPVVAKHTEPLKKPTSQAGILSSKIYLGRTIFEDTYAAGQHVFLDETSHMATFAMTGAGKLISSIAPNACMYRGSAVFISPKPELADMFLGRRTDVRLHERSRRKFTHNGVDPREQTQARFHIPGGRSFLLDPEGQSVYPSSSHNILSEIDPRRPEARSLLMAIAAAIIPDNPKLSEPFFLNACRGLLAAGMGHVLTADPHPNHHHLPYVVDRLMGIDPVENRSDPAVFQEFLIQMMQNPALGGLIQSAASNVLQLGSRAFGSVNAELGNFTRWLTDPMMREHLSQPSHFSYRELGDDEWPVSVFIVLPRIAMQEVLPFLRVHAELALQLLVIKRNRPAVPTLFFCDEFRQWGQSVRAIRDGATILRDARVRLWLFAQSWPSLVDILGEEGAQEFSSCATKQFYGINDQVTAEAISRALGQYTVRQRGRNLNPRTEQVYPLMTPDDVLRELRKNAPMQLVFPATTGPMRLERVAHKALVTSEGGRFAGLPLEGHYDELSRFTWG